MSSPAPDIPEGPSRSPPAVGTAERIREERGGGLGVADLPFETGSRSGHLLPSAVLGDNEEAGGSNAVDPDAQVDRRRGGSLLLYPEFDNRAGVISILTVTNAGPDTVSAHFVYYGP